MKQKIYITTLLLGFTDLSSGAIYTFNNVASGPGDTLYADSSNTYASGVVLTIGTFTPLFDLNNNLSNQVSLLTNYTPLHQVIVGSTSETFNSGGSIIYPGYTEYAAIDDASIVSPNALIGETLYAFVGNSTSLALSTEFALYVVGTIFDDASGESEYVINPSGATLLIGELSTSSVFPGLGVSPGTFNTLKTVAIVPEPSSLLISSLAMIALMRRKR